MMKISPLIEEMPVKKERRRNMSRMMMIMMMMNVYMLGRG
jgi:hypothetical protein